MYTARTASWNPAGAEPMHYNYKTADIEPGSLKWVKSGKYFSLELMVQINKRRYAALKPSFEEVFWAVYI